MCFSTTDDLYIDPHTNRTFFKQHYLKNNNNCSTSLRAIEIIHNPPHLYDDDDAAIHLMHVNKVSLSEHFVSPKILSRYHSLSTITIMMKMGNDKN